MKQNETQNIVLDVHNSYIGFGDSNYHPTPEEVNREVNRLLKLLEERRSDLEASEE